MIWLAKLGSVAVAAAILSTAILAPPATRPLRRWVTRTASIYLLWSWISRVQQAIWRRWSYRCLESLWRAVDGKQRRKSLRWWGLIFAPLG